MSHSEPASPPASWREPLAVLGFGVEGRSTLRHLRAWGFNDVVVLDRNPPENLPPGVEGVFGPDYLRGLDRVATAVRSPGLRPFQPEIRAFQERGGLLTSQVEAVFAAAAARIVGVTGTLGKGTCCSLLSRMLERGGFRHRLAGNIGLPPLDAWVEAGPEEWLLLELSSFQLSTLRQGPAAAIVLKTTSEHLDWHASREEYWDHKANLVRFQGPEGFCVYYADAEGSAFIAAQGRGRKIPVGNHGVMRLQDRKASWPEKDFRISSDETRLLGEFNLENVAAAAAAALELGIDPEAVRQAAREFPPLEHRLEFVREAGGIAYYNDSYATRPEAALGAVQALRGKPLGLILGGSEKHADFGELARGLKDEGHLRAIALMGQTAPRLKAALQAAGALEGRSHRECATLEAAMDFLRNEVGSGSLLLSPACASFGLFADYKERGKAFKRLVPEA